jgi:hypothetical protein
MDILYYLMDILYWPAIMEPTAMNADYSKAALRTFLDVVSAKALVNANTVNGWKAAFTRILKEEPDATDVRTIDIKTAIRRYHNGHPGVLSPASLQQYERRLGIVIEEFTKYQDDPGAYKGRGRHPTTAPGSAKKTGKIIVTGTGKLASSGGSVSATGTVVSGLSLEFPMRPDFLAQVVVPRDMTKIEARRFTHFIMTLAQDYDPTGDGTS